MAEESERGGNYFALGAIVGAALGAALALLFAPQPGQETRGMLKEKGIELTKRSRRVTLDVSGEGPTAVAQEAVDAAQEVIEQLDEE